MNSEERSAYLARNHFVRERRQRKVSCDLRPLNVIGSQRARRAHVYRDTDLQRIAAAVGMPTEAVVRYRDQLEEAALWLWLECGSPERTPPNQILRDLKRIRRWADSLREALASPFAARRQHEISKGARHLLWALGVEEHEDAADGPASRDIRDVLAAADGGSEDEVARTTGRIGLILECPDDLIGVSTAAEYLGLLAERAMADVQWLRDLTGSRGHQGDVTAQNWVADILPAYVAITGRKAATSVESERRHKLVGGYASGPLIRFLMAAARPAIVIKRWRWGFRYRTAHQLRHLVRVSTRPARS